MKILVLSGVPWHHTYQRHQKVAEALASFGEVTYATGIICRTPTLKDLTNFVIGKISRLLSRNSSRSKNPIPESVSLTKIRQLPESCSIFRWVNRYLSNHGDYDLVLSYLPHSYLNYYLNSNSVVIYDCVRDFDNWGGYPICTRRNEKFVVQECHDVWVDSYWLKRKIENYGRSNIYHIFPTFGSSLKPAIERYTRQARPESNNIRSICYYGSINNKIDIQLISKISESYSVTLIGPISNDIVLPDGLNVMGSLPQEKLFEQILQFDAIVVPYVGNMDGVIPAKTSELLNLPKPVFISGFYDSRKLHKSWYVYEDLSDLDSMLTNYDVVDFECRHNRNIDKFSKFGENYLYDSVLERLSLLGLLK